MATVATSTQNPVLQWSSQTFIDRDPKDGALYAMIKGSTANTFDVYRSTDNGGSWSLFESLTRANVREMGSIYITNVKWLHWCYRTNESNQDRIWWRRLNLISGEWSDEVLVGNPSNGGVADAVHSGMDLAVVVSLGQEFIAIATGTRIGTTSGVTLYGVRIDTNGNASGNAAAVFTGTRQWMHSSNGVPSAPSIDIEHNGDGKSSSAPHLWVTWGRTAVYSVKLAWQWRWNGPTTANKVTPVDLTPAQFQTAGRWHGSRFIIAVPDPTETSKVALYVRTTSNSHSSLVTKTPTHPAGVIRNCSFSYDSVDGDLRIYAVGTSNNDLYFIDRISATGAFTSWTTVTTTDILGSAANQWSVRRGSLKDRARFDVLTAHAGSPNTVVHTAQTVSYAPNTPTWDHTGIGYPNGAAANVASALVLDWFFSDPDPGDTQSAYAISRQIGVGGLTYWRASDNTWQATEIKNLTSTTNVSLPSPWASASDAEHHFRVKVWDSADTASAYSNELLLIPSGQVAPTVVSPTEGGTVTTSLVTLDWTVSEQTQFRVRLVILGVQIFDSGWVTSTDTEYEIPHTLANGFSYSAFLSTRNNEGLASAEVQRNFSVAFVSPPIASTVATPSTLNGQIAVAITNPAPAGSQPAFLSQDLWRRPVLNAILNANTSFEVDTAGWLAGVGGTAARDTGVGKFGTASLRLTPDGATAAPRLESDFILIDPSTSYHLDGWIMADTTNKGVALFFRWFTSGDVFISDSSPSYVTPLAADVFLYYGPIATSPSNAAKMKICAGLTATPAAGDRIWLDGVRVRKTDGTEGIRVAKGLSTGSTYDDWTAVSGVDYEYRVVVAGINGTASFGPWTS